MHEFEMASKGHRICMVTTARLGETTGGLESFTTQLACSLQTRGFTVVLVHGGLKRPVRYTLNPGELTCRRSSSPSPELVAPKLPTILYFGALLLFSVIASLLMLALNGRYRFDMIHCHDAGYSGLAGVICAMATRVPLIVQVHGLGYTKVSADSKSPYDRALANWDAALRKFVAARARKVLANSSEIREHLIQMGVAPERVTVIPSGTDLQRYRQAAGTDQLTRSVLGISENDFVIGYVGKLSPGKGVEHLVEAFCGLVESRRIPDNSRLVIVGSGTLRHMLSEKIRLRGLQEKVIFTGTRSDVYNILGAFNVFVFPSVFEGRGLALLEAMAAGRAIVASDIPTVREVVRDGENGLLVPPGSVVALEDTISLLLSSPKLRRKLAEGAFGTDLRKFDTREAVSRVTNIYFSTLSASVPSTHE